MPPSLIGSFSQRIYEGIASLKVLVAPKEQPASAMAEIMSSDPPGKWGTDEEVEQTRC